MYMLKPIFFISKHVKGSKECYLSKERFWTFMRLDPVLEH